MWVSRNIVAGSLENNLPEAVVVVIIARTPTRTARHATLLMHSCMITV